MLLTVCLFLWGDRSGPGGRWDGFFKYDADMVARLATQIRANLHVPHEVVVVTDRPADAFPSWVRHVDLMEHFGELRPMGGCWLRVKCFDPAMAEVLGKRVAWIDLDSVVVGDLTPLFDRPEPLVLYKSDSVMGQTWNGSLALFTVGDKATARTWGEFDPATVHKLTRDGKYRGTDQSWLAYVHDAGTPHWDWKDGILYYNLRVGRRLPEHGRLVTFPGRMKPSSPEVRMRAPWLRELWPMPGDTSDVKPWPVSGPIMGARLRTMQDVRRAARAMRA